MPGKQGQNNEWERQNAGTMTMDQEVVSLPRSVNEFRKFYKMRVQASSLALVHTAWSKKSLTVLSVPTALHTLFSEECAPHPTSTFL